ncbi:MAG: hypothetical protein C0600_06530 [Ignavibacteria bacterium]|nr:MAG: hypothetical protein C0600_06530 [Ignavibacteria bacterium]
MDVLQDILLILLTLAGVIVLFVLVSVLLRAQKVLQDVNESVQKISDEAVPTLRSIQQVSDRTEEALRVVTDNREKVTEAVDNLRKVTENIYRLENILQQQVEPTFVSLANRLAGIRKAIDTFFAYWRREG